MELSHFGAKANLVDSSAGLDLEIKLLQVAAEINEYRGVAVERTETRLKLSQVSLNDGREDQSTSPQDSQPGSEFSRH